MRDSMYCLGGFVKSIIVWLFIFIVTVSGYDLNTFRPEPFNTSRLSIIPEIEGHYYNYTHPKDYSDAIEEHQLRLTLKNALEWVSSYNQSNAILNHTHGLSLEYRYLDDTKYYMIDSSLVNSRSQSFDTVEERDWSTRLYSHGDTRLYLNNTMHIFLIHDVSGAAHIINHSDLYTTINHDDTRFIHGGPKSTERFSIGGLAGLGIGYGRTYEIYHAVNARYILRDLQEKNLLKQPITSVTISKLALVLHSLNKTRYFDSRDFRKLKLLELDHFFKKYDLVTDYTVEYAVILNDYTTLSQPTRITGRHTTLSARSASGIKSEAQTIDTTTTENYLYHYSIFGTLQHEYHRALNLYWHFDMNHAYHFGVYEKWASQTNQYNELQTIPFDVGYLSYAQSNISISYYPTTRTQFTNTIDGYYGYTQGELRPSLTVSKDAFDNHTFICTAASYFRWYVSEVMSIWIRASIEYTRETQSPSEPEFDQPLTSTAYTGHITLPHNEPFKLQYQSLTDIDTSIRLTFRYTFY